MNISPDLFLCLGLGFAALYFLIFTVGFILTMNARKRQQGPPSSRRANQP